MKKLLAMGLTVVLTVGCLSGCGEKKDDPGKQDPGSKSGDNKGNQESSQKKTFDDLGGMTISIGDWYTSEEVGESEYARATEDYRQEIMDKYNFKIKRETKFSYQDQQEKYVNGVMSKSPECQLHYLYQEKVAAPLMKGLMYDLSTLPEFDFKEEKWNQTVVELMSIGNGIWGMNPEAEPRGGVFFNKRMLKEAGIDEDEPYDLQKANKWTWTKFKEYCKKLTVDTDGDGKTDQYALASFSWDWYKAAFRDGEVAMQVSEVYEISAFATMEDNWGFVMFPYNEKNKDATNCSTPNDNIIVMPSCYEPEEAEKIAFAYDLYTEPTPEFDLDEAWKEPYYEQFRDERAVDETLTMMREPERKQTSYLPMLGELDYGDFCYSVYAGATTPAKQIEKVSSQWNKVIDDMNKKYENFAASHSK